MFRRKKDAEELSCGFEDILFNKTISGLKNMETSKSISALSNYDH